MNSELDTSRNVGKVLEKIREIVDKSIDADYIYRGEPECYSIVSSGIYRPFADFVTEHPNSKDLKLDIGSMEAAILKEAKEYLYEVDSDFEILAQLQHYGCKTNLIDFTTDYFIALFFACDGSPMEDGRVILLKKKSEDYEVNKPPEIIKRIESQKSILVRSLKGFVNPDDIVIIPKELKASMLNYLQKHHDISTKDIYKDIHGFIKWLDKYLNPNLEYSKAVIYHQKGDLANNRQEKLNWYEKAVDRYIETLRLKPDYFNAYVNRGVVYRDIGEFNLAFKDFDAGNRYGTRLCECL